MKLVQHTAAVIALAIAAGGLTGCAIERAQVAQDAQTKMVGLTKEQVLSCMGVPAAKAAEGAMEVWSYNSGNDHTQTATFGQSTTNALALRHRR
jgi:outer membrane protein assembly factor BamE (lipoprotein component of BamABCDE complex)